MRSRLFEAELMSDNRYYVNNVDIFRRPFNWPCAFEYCMGCSRSLWSENDLVATQSEAIQQLNAVKYVYLREITEPDKHTFNCLRIVVEEAVVNEAADAASLAAEHPELAPVLSGAHPIQSVEGCRTFHLSWSQYLAYLVTEELVGSNAPKGYEDEVYAGNILRRYTKSHFLDHFMRDTGGHIQDVIHYKIICLDHLIDVISYYAPKVELVSSDVTSCLQ